MQIRGQYYKHSFVINYDASFEITSQLDTLSILVLLDSTSICKWHPTSRNQC